MHSLHPPSVPLLSFYSTKPVPVFPLTVPLAVGVSPVVLPAQFYFFLCYFHLMTYSYLECLLVSGLQLALAHMGCAVSAVTLNKPGCMHWP